MAPSFARSISFPLSPSRSSSSSSSSSSTKKLSRHVRSISLPTCRSGSAHPLLAHLHATTLAARAWTTTSSSSSSPSAGLAHLDALHAALADLLALPEPRAALLLSSTTAAFSDRALDALLALADAHGALRETLLDLRRHAAEAQAALRRRRKYPSSALRAHRAAEKDLARLASAAARAARTPLTMTTPTATAAEVEVAGVIAEALAAAAAASAAVFSQLEAVSSAATAAAASATASSSKKPTIMSLVTRSSGSKAAAGSGEDREVAALERMERLDECVAEMEGGSDRVFRSILHTRVALLNIRTQQTC